MEQATNATNGAPQPMLTQQQRKKRLVPFDAHQKATVQRAYMQWLSTLNTVASCMGVGQAEINQDMTGFLVDDDV